MLRKDMFAYFTHILFFTKEIAKKFTSENTKNWKDPES